MNQQATHHQLHISGILGPEDYHILSCRYCYLIKDQLKYERFNRFWGILQQMKLRAIGYLRQTLYVFSKLAKLFFEKGKSYNASLIVGIRILISTMKYDSEPTIDITIGIFQISILLKRSRFFTTIHTD